MRRSDHRKTGSDVVQCRGYRSEDRHKIVTFKRYDKHGQYEYQKINEEIKGYGALDIRVDRLSVDVDLFDRFRMSENPAFFVNPEEQ